MANGFIEKIMKDKKISKEKEMKKIMKESNEIIFINEKRNKYESSNDGVIGGHRRKRRDAASLCLLSAFRRRESN
jgi:hypothetical protein